uniref:Uncharacterized protein n=1 Tax=Anguilla anguilla TaxID=7936 RepID=A0A0E9UEA7_ANGAN
MLREGLKHHLTLFKEWKLIILACLPAQVSVMHLLRII